MPRYGAITFRDIDKRARCCGPNAASAGRKGRYHVAAQEKSRALKSAALVP